MRKFVLTTGLIFMLFNAMPQPKIPQMDYTKGKTLHAVATAHFDTQWLWTIQTSINEYLPATMRDNFRLFEKFPAYSFSFEGAFKYMLMKEYYPADYRKVKDYIGSGRWNICGSSLDPGDVNIPSPEAIIRLILLGQDFFSKEFGKTSSDIFLPDCFGFGYALPSIAVHCGLKGFSTQKLSWGSSVGIPFDIGAWKGVDGSRVAAMLNPGSYTARFTSDPGLDTLWIGRINRTGRKSGLYVGYRYFGVGDEGGAPDEKTVEWLERSMQHDPDRVSGPDRVRVINPPADLLCRQLGEAQLDQLPQYDGELLVRTHGTGCYTSQCAMKRWNRKNELLADACERAALMADWTGAAEYPRQRLNTAWTRFLWHQFHDDLTGTSIPEAYSFSWNDELISLNEFGHILENSVARVAGNLDTRTEGIPLVVYNPLSIEREDVVEAVISKESQAAGAIRIFDPSGTEVPSQVLSLDGDKIHLLFLATLPPAGMKVFNASFSDQGYQGNDLKITPESLENSYYTLKINANGDVSSIFDKAAGKELLSSPVRLEMLDDTSVIWPAWEIMYDDVMAAPREYVDQVTSINVKEKGPVRVSLAICREKAGSVFTQEVRLLSGEAGQRIEFVNHVDWKTKGTLLKAAFPLSFSNDKATYDLGLGTIQRGNNHPQLYEVPAQQWANLDEAGGSYGVTFLNDCKYGWDKPAGNTLRLTLIHTPATDGSYDFQSTNDLGIHDFTFGLCPHRGSWNSGPGIRQAASLNQPLLAFRATPHPGTLGTSFSLLSVNTGQVAVRCVKKAENTDEIIVRVQELHGMPASSVKLKFCFRIMAAREVNGAEEAMDDLAAAGQELVFDLKPYQPRTFAIKAAGPSFVSEKPRSIPVPLNYDLDGVSSEKDMNDADFDGEGHSFPAELWQEQLNIHGIQFHLGSAGPGTKNFLECRGNRIIIPEGNYNRIYMLAAAKKDSKGTFSAGDREYAKEVPAFTGFFGQWDQRKGPGSRETMFNGMPLRQNLSIIPAYLKNGEIAWTATHRHNGKEGRNDAYLFCHLYLLVADLPAGARTFVLPDNPDIRIAAISAAYDPAAGTRAAQQLSDDLQREGMLTISSPGGNIFTDECRIEINCTIPGTEIFYTIDGSQPGENTFKYTGPFTVKESTTVRAAASGLSGKRLKTENHFTKAGFLPSHTVANPEPGVLFRQYRGEWKKLPDFSTLQAEHETLVKNIEMQVNHPDEKFGLVFKGYIQIPADGIYTFYLTSDDGSRFEVDDIIAINNDGLHGATEKAGMLALKEGYHPVRVNYFERGGDETFSLEVESAGMKRQAIPPQWLFH